MEVTEASDNLFEDFGLSGPEDVRDLPHLFQPCQCKQCAEMWPNERDRLCSFCELPHGG